MAGRNPPAQLTPKTKVNPFLRGKNVDVEVRKKLAFGEVVQSQLAQHYHELQTNKDKQSLKIIIATKIIKKYRLVTAARKLLRYGPETRAAHVTNKKKAVISAHRLQVQQFLESDDNSTMAPGKRDTIARNKIKMKKRFLNNTLFNLHQKCLKTNGLKISYSQFCRFKPFWIVAPNVNRRDTCLCIKHSNFEMLVSSLLRKDIISE